MEVLNDLVGYKNLKIYQNTDWFCFSLDSILLARLATVNLKTKKIVDFCTGNAPIPLILATRTKANIFGIEIQKEIADLAKKTVKVNKLENQINIMNEDIKNSFDFFNDETVDLVTCNPPYFKYDYKKCINENTIKSIARHEIKISLEEIIINSKKILKNKGRFALIHHASRVSDIIYLLNKYNFGIKRIVPIYSKTNDDKAELIFVESTKNTDSSVKIEKPMYIYEKENYTEEILKMFE